MDSGFQSHGFQIPQAKIAWIPDYLTWGDTDAYTSPLYIGDISVFLVYRRIYLAVVHRRHISPSYIQTYLPRRCTSARYQSFRYIQTHIPRRCTSVRYQSFRSIQTHIPRRCTSARYQSFLYTDAPTSPLYISEISVFLIYRRTYLAVVHRRDTSLRYMQTHLPRRCTSARY